MSDRVDELANDVDEAVTSAEALKDDPGKASSKKIERATKALKKAKDAVDEIEEADE